MKIPKDFWEIKRDGDIVYNEEDITLTNIRNKSIKLIEDLEEKRKHYHTMWKQATGEDKQFYKEIEFAFQDKIEDLKDFFDITDEDLEDKQKKQSNLIDKQDVIDAIQSSLDLFDKQKSYTQAELLGTFIVNLKKELKLEGEKE